MALIVTVTCDVPGCETRAMTKASEDRWDYGTFGKDGRDGWIDDTWQLPDGWTRAPEFGEAQHDDKADEGFRCPAHEGAPIGVEGAPLPPWVTEAAKPSDQMLNWLKSLPTALLFDPVTAGVIQQLSEQGAHLDERTQASLHGRVMHHRRNAEDSGQDYATYATEFLTDVLGPKLAAQVMASLA